MNKWVKAGLIAALAGMTLVYGGCGGNSAGSSKISGKKQVAVVQIMQHGSLDAANQGMIDGLKDKAMDRTRSKSISRMHRAISRI